MAFHDECKSNERDRYTNMFAFSKDIMKKGHSISYKIACLTSKDSDQSNHMQLTVIKIFAGHSVVAKDPTHLQVNSKDWSGCSD